MEGKPDPPHLRGIIPNSFQHIFEHVNSAKDVQFLIRASYLEIYNEEIRDLLSKTPKVGLELKENVDSGVYVKDLSSFVVKNVAGECFVFCLFVCVLCYAVCACVCLCVKFDWSGVLNTQPVVSLTTSKQRYKYHNSRHAYSLLPTPTHRDRPRDANGQDEPLHRCHGHEPDLFPQSQYLHHRGGVRRVRRQVCVLYVHCCACVRVVCVCVFVCVLCVCVCSVVYAECCAMVCFPVSNSSSTHSRCCIPEVVVATTCLLLLTTHIPCAPIISNTTHTEVTTSASAS